MRKEEQNRGAAMVVVLCILAIFLALSATILLTGSVTLNTARNNVTFELSKVQAASLSDLFAADMQRPLTEENSELPRYVRKEILSGGWAPYIEELDNREDAVRAFTIDRTEEEKNQIRIEMYWSGEGLPAAMSLEAEKELEGMDGKKLELHIDVVSTLGNAEYRVQSVFNLTGVEANPSYDPSDENAFPYIWNWLPEGRNKDA